MNPLRSYLAQRPLITAVVYTGMGILPLFLVSAQILQIGNDLDFGVARLGLATASHFGLAALAANPAGAVVARMGPGQGLRLGAGLTIVSCLIAATASIWWLIPVAMMIAGIANAAIQVSANVAIFDGVAERRQGLAFGAKQASVPMASLLAGISLPIVGLVFGWRWVFAGAALIALALVISAPKGATRSTGARAEKPMGRPPRSLLVLLLAGFSGAVAGNGLSYFVIPSAVEVGIEEATAGIVLAASSLLVVIVRLGAGWTVDRRRSLGHLEMTALVAAGTIGALVLMTTSTAGTYLAAMPVALLGAWGWPGVFFFTVVNSYPEFPARASGIVISSNLTGTVIGPLVVAFFAGAGNYSAAWLFVGAAAAVSTTAFIFSYLLSKQSEQVSSRDQPEPFPPH